MRSDLDNSPFEVLVYIDLRDHGCFDVSQVEISGLVAKTRPACRTLALDGHNGRIAAVCSSIRHVEDVKTNTCICGEDSVLPRNDSHGERQKSTLPRCDLGEVIGEGAILADVPD